MRHFLVSRPPQSPPPTNALLRGNVCVDVRKGDKGLKKSAYCTQDWTGLFWGGGGGVASVISDSLRWFPERAHPPQDHVLLCEQSRSSTLICSMDIGQRLFLGWFFFFSLKSNSCCHFPVENDCPLMFFFIFIKSTRLLLFFFCIFVDFVEYLCDYCFIFVRNDYYFSFCCGRGLALTEMGSI